MLYIILCLLFINSVIPCQQCYNEALNRNCPVEKDSLDSYTLHMSVHPHLDAYWIFNFQSYYDPKPTQGEVRGYFMSNRFNSVKQIFQSAKDVLWESKIYRETKSNKTMKAHRTFFNSQMGFFKRWYSEQPNGQKIKVKQLLKTKYWQIMGGGYVQHDQGCSYYDDIIQNFELGLHFLKEQFNYFPKVAISADSFGHSQSTLAILAHLGIEGFFVERSDQHILLKNKTQFIWKAKSANGRFYGAMPTHIRWAIHGFQDQFIGSGNSNQAFCTTKENYMNNMRNENNFLKNILKSSHIMRYFGHDFQRFNDYSYSVIENMMKKYSMQKCNKVVAVYGNPTQYFISLMGEVFGKNIKPIVERNQDIFPIWDYDSGLYWTGYLTTDAYHKKDYRNLGRFLRAVRKFFTPIYLSQPQIDKNKQYYKDLQLLAEQVSYLAHHDGITGTSKYMVMDTLERDNLRLYNNINNHLLADIFEENFPLGTNSPIFTCNMDQPCKIPNNYSGNVYLKILNTDADYIRDPVVIDLPIGKYYTADCQFQHLCFCLEKQCPCKLYLYKPITTYTVIKLTLSPKPPITINLEYFHPNQQYSVSQTHFIIKVQGREYALGYKRVQSMATNRQYDHLSRFGTRNRRGFNIRPGKYALGNVPSTAKDFSEIKQVFTLKSQYYTFFLIHWKRYKMKTFITINNNNKNEWKVQTLSASEAYYLSDLYFEVITPIQNAKKYVTDSNGWLTLTRQLFKHQDYEAFFSPQGYDDINGNTYPVTSFIYIEDENDKVSINVDRPQGGIASKKGTIWLNFDRLSDDDGKWVYQNTYRSQYQKYTHVVTVKNKNYNERKIQRLYDQPLLIQGNSISAWDRIEDMEIDLIQRGQWNKISNINNIKFTIRPFNNTKTILRVHNLHDTNPTTIGLFAGNYSPFLTTFYARTATFKSITQGSLGGNMNYAQFLNKKWNWEGVTQLKKQNDIFNKIFRENITLSPLQIRTFIIQQLSFDDKCIQVSQIKYNKQQIDYTVDLIKPAPKRDPISIRLQQEIINYMKNQDHCLKNSPVLQQTNLQSISPIPTQPFDTIFPTNLIKDIVYINTPQETKMVDHANEIKPKDISQDKPKQPNNPQIIINKPQTIINKPDQKEKVKQNIVNDRLVEIQSKVQNLLLLSPQQKEYYFRVKLQMIKKWKNAKS